MKSAAFTFERESAAGGILRFDGATVAYIRDLVLRDARFTPGPEPHLAADPGTPLYWRQYERHEDPERSASSHLVLDDPCFEDEEVRFSFSSATASRSILSSGTLRVTHDPSRDAFLYHVRLELEITGDAGWRVTRHPQHGELEFCSLWPAGTWPTDPGLPKRFQSCLFERGSSWVRIPHHHLESADKHHIPLVPGGRFLWMLEDVNPCIMIIWAGADRSQLRERSVAPTTAPAATIEAGLCAYMWDAHVALRVCRDAEEIVLPRGARYRADYVLHAFDRTRAAAMLASALPAADDAALDAAVIMPGLNTFARTFRDELDDLLHAWPWMPAVVAGEHDAVALHRSSNVGCSDDASLSIVHQHHARSRWEATALGPAYGGPPFADDVARRLTAMIRTSALDGVVRLALRIHREGSAQLFDIDAWERYESAPHTEMDGGWTRMQLDIPPISPRPDRVHILLEMEGTGVVWFDDVLLEEIA